MFRLRLVDWGQVNVLDDNLERPDEVAYKAALFYLAVAERTLADEGNPPGSFHPRVVPNVAGVIKDLRVSETPKSRRFDDRPVPFDTGELRNSLVAERTGPGMAAVGHSGAAQHYAEIQHEGGESETEEITKEVVDRLSRWITKEHGRQVKKSVEADPVVLASKRARDHLKETLGPKPKGTGAEALKASEARLRKVRKIRREKYREIGYAGEHYDLAWLVNDRWIGQRLKIKVRARPWFDFREQDHEDLREILGDELTVQHRRKASPS